MPPEVLNHLFAFVLGLIILVAFYFLYEFYIFLTLKKLIDKEVVVCRESYDFIDGSYNTHYKHFGSKDIVEKVERGKLYLQKLQLWIDYYDVMSVPDFEHQFLSNTRPVKTSYDALLRAIYLCKEGLQEEGLKFIRQGIKLARTVTEADHYRIEYALQLYHLERYQDAIKCLSEVEAPEAAVNFFFYHSTLAACYFCQEKYEHAFEEYAKLELDITKFDTWLFKPYSLLCAEKYAEAHAEFTELAKADENQEYLDIYYFWNIAAYRAGDHKTAEFTYNFLYGKTQDQLYAGNWHILYQSTDKELMEYLNRFISTSPENPDAYFQRAYLSVTAWDKTVRDGNLALKDIELCLSLEKYESSASCYFDFVKACAHAELGNFSTAINLMNDSLPLSPAHERRKINRIINNFKNRIPYYDEFSPQRRQTPQGEKQTYIRG